MDGWTLIFSSDKIQEIELLKAQLQEFNIVSVIVNKQDSFYLIGDIELYVPIEDAFNANQLINKFQSE